MEGILGLKRPLCSAARTKLKEEREEKRKWHKVNVVERHWEKVKGDVEWDEAGNEERKWHKVNVVERHWEKVNGDVEWDEAGNEKRKWERVREGWQQKRKKEKRQKKEKKQDI